MVYDGRDGGMRGVLVLVLFPGLWEFLVMS
jgi:hypothetical protein